MVANQVRIRQSEFVPKYKMPANNSLKRTPEDGGKLY